MAPVGSPVLDFYKQFSSADEYAAACGAALLLCACAGLAGFRNERDGVPPKERHPVELCG